MAWVVSGKGDPGNDFRDERRNLSILARMTAKKTAKPVNKTAFVKHLPKTMPAKEVVAKAKAAGITLTEMYVYSIRSKSKARKSSGIAKRGPGRPRKDATSAPTTFASVAHSVGGLVSEIEHIVERKVNAILHARFGALFGR
jgi:hypothetical protein